MNTDRAKFLTSLFASFDEERIGYCVSRNAGETFGNTGSDLDLVIASADLSAAERLCGEVAEKNGYRLALRTRFTNLCLLFWSPVANFIRIDIDSAIRWKVFPVVSAEQLIEGKKSDGSLFIPSPLGEALVLSAKVAWMGKLSERYGARLKVLHQETDGFPDAGKEARKIIGLAQAGDSAGLRSYLIKRSLGNPASWLSVAAFVLDDVKRVVRRAVRTPGVFVRFRGSKALDWERLLAFLHMGFPVQKTYIYSGKPRLKKAFLSLFRGGGVFEKILDHEQEPPPSCGGLAWALSARANRISIFRPENGSIYLADEASGLLSEIPETSTEVELKVADLIGRAMSQKYRSRENSQQGKFVVLVGLDGAGKTTFARNLCAKLAGSNTAQTVRYFHWIPSLQKRSHPWPSFKETPRKSPTNNMVETVFSIVRLIKNVMHARIVYHLGIRRWVKHREFVIVDRFIYNYWLDPVSLRYSGPRRLLDFAAKLIPKPDLIFSLEADADILLSRKGELTREEIEQQSRALRSLPVDAERKVVLDARLNPAEVVDEAMKCIY